VRGSHGQLPLLRSARVRVDDGGVSALSGACLATRCVVVCLVSWLGTIGLYLMAVDRQGLLSDGLRLYSVYRCV
jgi:hypothetical protein